MIKAHQSEFTRLSRNLINLGRRACVMCTESLRQAMASVLIYSPFYTSVEDQKTCENLLLGEKYKFEQRSPTLM